MVQGTSLKAYKEIQEDLQRRQAEVMSKFGPDTRLTNTELARLLGWPINRVTPRVFELRAKHKLTSYGKRLCIITQRTAIQWGIPKEQRQGDLFNGLDQGKS